MWPVALGDSPVMDLSSYALLRLRSGDLTLYRGSGNGVTSVLVLVAENPSSVYLKRLEHEYSLRADLDVAWAARPAALSRCAGRFALVMEDPGGALLEGMLGQSLEPTDFLRIAIPLAETLGRAHARGFIHKDIKPAHILFDSASGRAWLTGFGIASRLPREHQHPDAPEVIAGTLAYMAPEQTGRMNRSIDARSDLYSLGITFYEMLTGTLPFSAADPLGWAHCHIAHVPIPPDKRVRSVPAQLSAIVMKLLAKTAEERYQTAAGVAADLQQCLAQLNSHGRIDLFPLGATDSLDRLLIPEKLYGRDREVGALLAAFDSVATEGTSRLVLVSGYSGIGKSSVVNELHRALVAPRGLFAAGKFDQYKRDIPYATFAQASQSLVRSLLSGEADLGHWRESIREALGPNGQVVVNLVPELELIIGPQPPIPDLAPADARRLFQSVFRRFLGVFARKEHPLALFLDDLQWLDAAMLDLLEELTTSPDMRHLMVIGVYRDNEVDSTHPLMHKLDVIRRAGANVQKIVLAPLLIEDLARLLVDSLHCEPERVTSLAQLVHEKTGGNPFFAVQFITSLAEEGLLGFDHGDACWSWDMDRIHAKGYSDNVADLMVGKLNRLPRKTQRALQQLACLGNHAEFDQLSMVYEDSEVMHGDLREAVRAGLILPSDRGYRFLHDRVQEAAYSSIPEDARAIAHLRIGRLLESRTAAEKIEDNIFEIVSQLNRGRHLILSPEERDRVAKLNGIAGRRAKAASAYASALAYFGAARAMLSEHSGEDQFRLTFNLELNQAECEYLTGERAIAEKRLAALSERAANLADMASVIDIQVDLYNNWDRIDSAIGICVSFLHRVGLAWTLHPSDDEVRQEYASLCQRIGGRSIERLADLPAMKDSNWRTVMRVLGALSKPAGILDTNLMDLTTLRMANLSLEYGNSDESCSAYAHVGMALGPRFGDHRLGCQFGQLGVVLADKSDLIRFKTRVYACVSQLVLPWGRHIRESYALAQRACEAGLVEGDLTYSSYAWTTRVSLRFDCGHLLSEVQAEGENALACVQKAFFVYAINLITPVLRLVQVLRGLTPMFGTFNDSKFDETRYELYLEERRFLPHDVTRYFVRKLQARFFAGDYASALAAVEKVDSILAALPHLPMTFENVEYHFYAALSHAACSLCSSVDERSEHMSAVAAHYGKLRRWEVDCPANFTSRAALVGAEWARLQGRHLEAEELYERSIASAREHGFIQNEGLAYELAARFYEARGFKVFSDTYLQNARSCYVRWGAVGKVRQMDRTHPHLVPQTAVAGDDGIIGTPVEHLDLATVVKVSQAISGEIDFNRLIDILMNTALEHAGGQRGVLILTRDDGSAWIEAEAITGENGVQVHRSKMRVTPSAVPESVLNYVTRTKDSVLLDDASAQDPYSADEYVRRNKSRSILCLPLIKQAHLIGVLYLENRLASHVFTPGRIAVLRLLASQAATSLENARLYSDLRDADAFRAQAERLSHTGSFKWSVSSGELFWSEETYRIHGFEPSSELSMQRLFASIHPDDVNGVRERLDRSVRQKEDLEFECRIVMPDTLIKYLHVVARTVTDAGELHYIGALMDVTSFREAQKHLHKSQADLAHVGRLTTMGELAASIAHEVAQPLMAVVTNAESCLLWLGKEEPNLDKARNAAQRIIKNGHRAGDVVKSIRSLARKALPERIALDINGVIRETLDLMQEELRRQDVSCEILLTEPIGLIKGDRTQLQQVILNLVMNGAEAMSTTTGSPRVLRIITAFDHDGGVTTSIEDSGSGIDAGMIDRIFEPLFTTKPEGMGLGLSICRSIVEAHGGRLWVLPNPIGGSIFRFSIPEATKGAEETA